MGNCKSCDSIDVATAKVIFQDGRLQEFACPVKVSQVLERNPSCIICNSDDMDFDSFVSAINGDDQLHAGQLYFALPVTWLKNPLRAEEMASLAVKANFALKSTPFGRQSCCSATCGPKRVDAEVYNSTRTSTGNTVWGSYGDHQLVVGGGRREGGSRPIVGGRGRGYVEKRSRRLGGRHVRNSSITTKLNVILEE